MKILLNTTNITLWLCITKNISYDGQAMNMNLANAADLFTEEHLIISEESKGASEHRLKISHRIY